MMTSTILLALLALQGHEHHVSPTPAEEKQVHPESREMSEPLVLPHTRDASGTAWQPDSTPMQALHYMEGDWMFMLHGNLFAGYDYQSGRRGGDQMMSTNWAMLMA